MKLLDVAKEIFNNHLVSTISILEELDTNDENTNEKEVKRNS